MPDDNFALIQDARSRLPEVCREVLMFARSEVSVSNIKPGRLPLPVDEDSRLLAATLEGYLQRHVSLLGAILALEGIGYRDEWLMLSRALFEVSVDANYLWNTVLKHENPVPMLQRIKYSWSHNYYKLLNESEHISADQFAQAKAQIVKVPGLSVDEHKKIEVTRNFTGLNMAERCKATEAGPYYKPVFGRLSRYAHGMTYDWEMGYAQQRDPRKLKVVQTSEEALNLMHCSLLVLIALKYLCAVTGRDHDLARAGALEEKLSGLLVPAA